MSGLKPGARGLRIAHVSDFHFARWKPRLDACGRLLKSLDYDLLAVTGDFSARPHQWSQAAYFCRRFFDGIKPRYGAFAVLGNHDDRRLAEQRNLPFRMLRNEHVRLNVGGTCVVVAGVEQSIGERGDLDSALAGAPASAATILLAHYPSTVFNVPQGRVGLVLSGHTHGGQIRLPWLGCIWTNDRLPVSMARGLHEVGDVSLHVNPGIGASALLPIRFRCPPEISVMTLECRQPAYDPAPGPSNRPHFHKSLRRRRLPARV